MLLSFVGNQLDRPQVHHGEAGFGDGLHRNGVVSGFVQLHGADLAVDEIGERTGVGNFVGESLLANGKEAKVMLSIPKNALGNVKTVSLQLTDADQKLQLEIPGLVVK